MFMCVLHDQYVCMVYIRHAVHYNVMCVCIMCMCVINNYVYIVYLFYVPYLCVCFRQSTHQVSSQGN